MIREFLFTDKYYFPKPSSNYFNGLVAVGYDVSPTCLMAAYTKGLFPWFSEGEEPAWYSPDPRFVVTPAEVYVSKTMRQSIRRNTFQVTINTAFKEVMTQCGITKRRDGLGTWITNDLIKSFHYLHKVGYAHSVEVWQNDRLVGGLYGLVFGNYFAGESMFSHVSNASKTGFILFSRFLEKKGIVLIDCQTHTDHLESLGAYFIPREEFLTFIYATIPTTLFDSGIAEPYLLADDGSYTLINTSIL